MPKSVNGCGTSLVSASKKTAVAGSTQFDPVEGVTLFYLLLLPYKCMHILSLANAPNEAVPTEKYQFIKLRFSCRIIAKAFLNRWGNVLLFFGAFSNVIISIPRLAMGGKFSSGDVYFIIVAAALLLMGIVSKSCWWLLDVRDQRIKSIIGVHQLGTSDPYYWRPENATAAAQQLVVQQPGTTLLTLANQYALTGNRLMAMYCVRLAMRTSEYKEARRAFRRFLKE
jgi:hypothetical protein